MTVKIPLLEGKFLSKIALVAFLLTLPLSVRKVFFVLSPDGSGIFNEYTDISLYLSDITLFILLLVIILENKKNILSILWWKRMFHVEQLLLPMIAPLPFLCWSALSILWSKSEILAFYATFRLFEGYFLYLAIIFFIVPRGTMIEFYENCSTWNNLMAIKNYKKMFHVEQLSENPLTSNSIEKIVPRGTIDIFTKRIKNCSTWNNLDIVFIVIIASGLIQAIIAILQFAIQSSLGLIFLKESVFFPSQSGIAKIVLENDVLIRSYGLFPHPNILGFFLGLSILLTITYPLITGKKLFHVEQFIPLYRGMLFIQVLSFLLAFSKSAYISIILAILYYFTTLFHVEHVSNTVINVKNVPRGTIQTIKKWLITKCSTWNNSFKVHKMFHVEHRKYLASISILVFLPFLFLIKVDWFYFFVQPITERYFFFQEFFAIAHQNFFTGVGIGQSVFLMQDFFSEKLNLWQLQPIHSLYLLIFSEIGFIGFVFFLLFILILIVPRGTILRFRGKLKKCSTWNISKNNAYGRQKVFHVEHFTQITENVPRGTFRMGISYRAGRVLIIFVLFIAFFDHYLFDIQQGQLLFWLVLGLCSVFMKKE